MILVKGSPLELQKRLHRDIYFDQQGILTSKFGIKHVPAIVFQKADEKFLTILEVVAPRAITASPLAERYARCTGDIEAESIKVNESSVTLVESK
ncbi:hypothetical protein FACS1894122_07980 [Alphaproteobacteria bacterium]|nr:hypothetical protein FACS1894122_07980 [Alphaproteobacteria bacterium]